MLRYLHQLSSFFFYLLGSSFFIAYVLLKQKLWATEAAVWLQVADLPLAFTALLYGGLSLHFSLHFEKSKILSWVIGVPLSIVFGVILIMNFWPT